MSARSLTARIISLSIFWIALALGCTAWLLASLYRDHIEEHYDAHIFTHVEELVAAVQTTDDGQVRLNRQPTDPRFHRIDSGWYWQLQHGVEVLEKSHSLGDRELDLSGVELDEKSRVQIISGLNDKRLRAQIINVSYAIEPGSLTFVATAPEMQISDDVKDFMQHVALSLLVLGVGLSLAVVVQVRLALKPLKAIRTAIGEVRAGKTDRLPREFPSDVQPLANELNHLIDHNEMLLKRARNQVSDLAHAVKNPLTVIRNAARNMTGSEGQLVLDQSHIMASSIDHCLTRARTYGRRDAIGYRTSVKPVIDDVHFAVDQIYRERDIEITAEGLEGLWFRGEAQDLEEMVGNLLDNGCKWASSRVQVQCDCHDSRLSLSVEDDGPGIKDEDIQQAIRRGARLDESQPGYGQGLGIVRDIAQLYGGSLLLDRSELGGVRATLDLPAT